MKCLPLLLICSGCAPADGFNPDIAQHAIELWHLGPDSEPFARIVPHPIPGRPELCVAITDTQTEWWGEFGVYAIKDGKVAWQAVGGGDPMEQSILAVRGLRLPGFSGPIIEVFGQTHMGNGNLYLYELQDRELVLLLDTWAVDCHEDRYTFKSGRLSPDYRDLNGDGVCDVTLRGEVEDRGEDSAIFGPVIATIPCRKVLLWSPAARKFVEDLSKREGFDAYPD